jgi:hypothetical protein
MNEDLIALRQIDFLPDRFRNAKEKRHASVWRLALAVVFAGMLSAAALYQYHLLRLARHELAQVDLMHHSATSLTKQLADAQLQLAPLDKVAQLLTYLSSPWPKSQLVAHAVANVPDSATLRGLEIHFEKAQISTTTNPAATPEQPDAAKSAPSAERDLARLHQSFDGGQWVIVLTGSTSNLSELHIYLAELEHQPLFAKVELVSIEAAAAGSNQSQFVARIIVKPPHGNVVTNVVLSFRERTTLREQSLCS